MTISQEREARHNLVTVRNTLLFCDPNSKVSTVIAQIDREIEALSAIIRPDVKGNCLKCGRQVTQFEGTGKPFHIDSTGALARGCRAATWNPDAIKAWDMSIPKSWYATLA